MTDHDGIRVGTGQQFVFDLQVVVNLLSRRTARAGVLETRPDGFVSRLGLVRLLGRLIWIASCGSTTGCVPFGRRYVLARGNRAALTELWSGCGRRGTVVSHGRLNRWKRRNVRQLPPSILVELHVALQRVDQLWQNAVRHDDASHNLMRAS